MKPGIYTMAAELYHADPCPAPSLSASMAKILLDQSPLHAWTAHPKLNPHFEREDDGKFDLGTAAHAYVLEGAERFEVVPFYDWRKKEAQALRDEIRAAGKIPLLQEQVGRVLMMAKACQRQLDVFTPRPFSDGRAEETVIWQEPNGVWCRARLDWIATDESQIWDYKTTEGSAHPEAWARGPLFGNGYDIQAAFYRRGVQMVGGPDPEFTFVVQEAYDPHALSVIGLEPGVRDLGTKKVLRAIELWGECLKSGHWPGYPTRVASAELPPWEETRWMQREYMEIAEKEARG
ncbi:MAG TPA: PD-(D/E)XK nuclease-like domain-containing protein [Methylomirabilota bacterium]|nr:PD-(D/E)XK nuclease-like domain-containing protein [Methylomirabilota bacterium]